MNHKNDPLFTQRRQPVRIRWGIPIRPIDPLNDVPPAMRSDQMVARRIVRQQIRQRRAAETLKMLVLVALTVAALGLILGIVLWNGLLGNPSPMVHAAPAMSAVASTVDLTGLAGFSPLVFFGALLIVFTLYALYVILIGMRRGR